MKNTDDLLTYGYEFNLGKYFQDGWELYKKGAGNYIGFTIVFFIIVMMLIFVPFVNMLVTVVEYVLIAGVFIYTRNLTLNKGEFSNFFEGFKKLWTNITIYLDAVGIYATCHHNLYCLYNP